MVGGAGKSWALLVLCLLMWCGGSWGSPGSTSPSQPVLVSWEGLPCAPTPSGVRLATVSGQPLELLEAELKGEKLLLQVRWPEGQGEPWVAVGPCWTTPPLVEVPAAGEVIEPLPAAPLLLQVPENQQLPPMVGRFVPIDGAGQAQVEVWALPFVRQRTQWQVMVPHGRWQASVYVPGFTEHDLGVLQITQGLASSFPWQGQPAASFKAHLRTPAGTGALSLWALPEARWPEASCLLTTPEALEELAGGQGVERGGWVRQGGLSPGRYLLTANPPGLPAQLWGPFELAAGREHDLGELEVGQAQLHVAVEGVASFLDHPFHRPWVWVLPGVFESPNCSFMVSLEKGLPATFTLPPGSFKVQVVAQAYPSQKALGEFPVEDVSFGVGEERVVVLQPAFAPVVGEVVAGGKGATCLVQLTVETPGGERHRAEAWSLPNGHFSLLGLPRGEGFARLRCTTPEAEALVRPVRVAPGEKLKLTLPEGELQVLVVDGEGYPLAERRVLLWPLSKGGQPGDVESQFERVTNPQGKARFAHLGSGEYLVWSVSPQGKETDRQKVVVGEAGEKQQVRLVEEQDALKLRFLSPTGQPVAGVRGIVVGWGRGELALQAFPGGELRPAGDGYRVPIPVESMAALPVLAVVPGGGVLCRRLEA